MGALLAIPSSRDEEFKPVGKISSTQHMGLTLLLSASPWEPEEIHVSWCHLNPLSGNIGFCVLVVFNVKRI